MIMDYNRSFDFRIAFGALISNYFSCKILELFTVVV
jgi:hypothetical protein